MAGSTHCILYQESILISTHAALHNPSLVTPVLLYWRRGGLQSANWTYPVGDVPGTGPSQPVPFARMWMRAQKFLSDGEMRGEVVHGDTLFCSRRKRIFFADFFCMLCGGAGDIADFPQHLGEFASEGIIVPPRRVRKSQSMKSGSAGGILASTDSTPDRAVSGNQDSRECSSACFSQ